MSDSVGQSHHVQHEAITSFRLKPAVAVSDIIDGTARWRVWTALAWHEFSSVYRRSFLGVLWVMISFGGFVAVKIIIFSKLLNTSIDSSYEAYLVLGFFIWMYLQQSISAAPDAFTSVKGWIRSEPLPFSLYIWKAVTREFYNLAMTSIVVVVALLYLQYPVKNGYLYSLLAMFFLLVNAFSVKLLLGVVSARIQDLSHMIKAIMLPMMFLTPIFWMPEQMGSAMEFLWWNPFFHYLEIFRAPLMTGAFPLESWIFVLSLWAAISLVGFLIFARFRQRIVYWF